MKIFSTKTSFEQRKTPRYIYHLTNGYNYKSMLKDGYIIAKKNDAFINNKAVFAFDIQNFINKWGLHKDWHCANDKDTLRTSLLKACTYWMVETNDGKNDLVLLKIPTEKLNPKKLKIRSQNIFFKILYSKKSLINFPYKTQEHAKGNILARNRNLHKHEAIEYIYEDNIPISDVIVVGSSVNMYLLRKQYKSNSELITKEALTKILKNTPEEKSLNNAPW